MFNMHLLQVEMTHHHQVHLALFWLHLDLESGGVIGNVCVAHHCGTRSKSNADQSLREPSYMMH